MKTALTNEQISRAEWLIGRLSSLAEVTASDVRELVAAELLCAADRDLLLSYAEVLP
jgi:hypothetical protein